MWTGADAEEWPRACGRMLHDRCRPPAAGTHAALLPSPDGCCRAESSAQSEQGRVAKAGAPLWATATNCNRVGSCCLLLINDLLQCADTEWRATKLVNLSVRTQQDGALRTRAHTSMACLCSEGVLLPRDAVDLHPTGTWRTRCCAPSCYACRVPS